MSDFFDNESVFKKPAIPCRYQKTHFGSHSEGISNCSGYTASKLKEKIEILEKVFPQNDNIWENLIKNVDHLCFVKVSEQVLQPNSQQSLLNGVSTCPNTFINNIGSNEKIRNNYTHSTNNTRDYFQPKNQKNHQRCNPVLQETKQQEYCRTRSQNTFSAPVPQEFELPEYPRYTRLQNVYQVSEQTEYQRPKSRSSNISRRFAEPEEISCEPQVTWELKTENNSIRHRKKKVTKENDSTCTSKSYVPTSSTLRISVPSTAVRSVNNRARELIRNVDCKSRRSAELTVREKSSQPVTKSTRDLSNVSSMLGKSSTQKEDEPLQKNTPDLMSGASSISEKPPKRKKTELPTKNRDLSVLNSEDENDSLAAFFQRKRKKTVKKTAAAKLSTVPSITLSRAEGHPTRKTRKQPISQSSKENLESDENRCDSDDSTEDVTKSRKTINKRKQTVEKSRKVLPKRPTKKKKVENNIAKQRKAEKKQSQDLDAASESARTSKISAPSPVNDPKPAMDGSFFGEVSSILENGEVTYLRLDRRRKGKRSSDHDASMPFSPFVPGNSRSTSGYSAISTPLSKSVSKNALGKRIKKPSVVAELKGELRRTRKKDCNKIRPNTIQPAFETTATTESECEASDYSDVD